jgi:hypothetical protein
MDRMMTVQEVILKAMAGSLKWWEAAEIIGVFRSDDEAVAGALTRRVATTGCTTVGSGGRVQSGLL